MAIILVPDWENISEDPKSLSTYLGYGLKFDLRYDAKVIEFKNRYETLPADLKDVPFRVVAFVKHNSPVSKAEDGRYTQDNFRARVETYIVDGVAQQHIRVEGFGESLESVNDWFDELVDGEKRFSSKRFARDLEKRCAMDR